MFIYVLGFPGSSVGKESACHAGDPSSIPGSGRSLGEGIGSLSTPVFLDFSGSSVGKGSACNAGDPGSISGSGRCPRRGIGYPLQYSWASLVSQMVKNPPTMRETWVGSLGWEDSLEEDMATHSSILAWKNPVDRGAWRTTVHGVTKSPTWLSIYVSLTIYVCFGPSLYEISSVFCTPMCIVLLTRRDNKSW